MAKVEIINIRGNKERCVNLSHSVGMGGINSRGDLMMIQALFNYLSSSGKGIMTIIHDNSLLPMTGFPDGLTLMRIAQFQAANKKHLISADYVIHPASYKNRVIKDTTKPLMTITYLHLLAKRVELKYGHDYVSLVTATFKLRHIVEGILHPPGEADAERLQIGNILKFGGSTS